MMIRTLFLAVALLFITGCDAMKIDDFTDTEPAFVPEEYFIGKTKAWGIFQDRFGSVRRDFVVDINGYMDGDILVLDEDFVYSDGEIDQRTWRITKLDDDTYEGEANDIIGKAQGERRGRAMRWRYDFDLVVGGRSWQVHFDDWMLLQDENVMVNRTTVSKWGLTIGEVYIFFMKQPEAATGSGADEASSSRRQTAAYDAEQAAE